MIVYISVMGGRSVPISIEDSEVGILSPEVLAKVKARFLQSDDPKIIKRITAIHMAVVVKERIKADDGDSPKTRKRKD